MEFFSRGRDFQTGCRRSPRTAINKFTVNGPSPPLAVLLELGRFRVRVRGKVGPLADTRSASRARGASGTMREPLRLG